MNTVHYERHCDTVAYIPVVFSVRSRQRCSLQSVQYVANVYKTFSRTGQCFSNTDVGVFSRQSTQCRRVQQIVGESQRPRRSVFSARTTKAARTRGRAVILRLVWNAPTEDERRRDLQHSRSCAADNRSKQQLSAKWIDRYTRQQRPLSNGRYTHLADGRRTSSN